MKNSKVCITTRSPLASFLFKGLVTKHTTVKWTIRLSYKNHILVKDNFGNLWKVVRRTLFLIFTEIEQQRLMDLEAQKNRLDQETSTKLAEFNNR